MAQAIYYKGRIYQGKLQKDEGIELIGQHYFQDNQPVVLGKDYEMKKEWWGNGYWISDAHYDGPREGERKSRTVAVPLVKEEGEKKFIVGEKYVLDKDFNNSSVVTLVSFGTHFGKVKSEDSEWETMLNRLSEIPPISVSNTPMDELERIGIIKNINES